MNFDKKTLAGAVFGGALGALFGPVGLAAGVIVGGLGANEYESHTLKKAQVTPPKLNPIVPPKMIPATPVPPRSAVDTTTYPPAVTPAVTALPVAMTPTQIQHALNLLAPSPPTKPFPLVEDGNLGAILTPAQVQQAIAGTLDTSTGHKSRMAVVLFQHAQGLRTDSDPGPQTQAVLDSHVKALGVS